MDYKEIRKIEARRERKKKEKQRRKIISIISILIIIAVATGIFFAVKTIKAKMPQKELTIIATKEPTNSEGVEIQKNTEAQPESTEVPTPTEQPLNRRGTAEPIPQNIRDEMMGLSYKSNNNISLDDLRYLTIPIYDFSYTPTTGHLVVNAALAEDVLDIFAELYDIKYPIEKMELVDKYNASDYQSIEANNTSCFNYRESTDGSGRISQHGYGRAIDINPQINPYVDSNGQGAHANAEEYWSRNPENWSSEIAKAAFIGSNTQIYNIFINHGWTWGGAWSSYHDYQHFEKR